MFDFELVTSTLGLLSLGSFSSTALWTNASRLDFNCGLIKWPILTSKEKGLGPWEAPQQTLLSCHR